MRLAPPTSCPRVLRHLLAPMAEMRAAGAQSGIADIRFGEQSLSTMLARQAWYRIFYRDCPTIHDLPGPSFWKVRDGQFSWNALRFPWRLSLDFLETGEPRASGHLISINRWIRKSSHDDPKRISTTYRLDGSTPDDQTTGSAAFIAMFASAAVAGSGDPAGDQQWIDALWSALTAIPIADEDYYGNTLKLMVLMELSEQWRGN